jgi:SAM-dependent methyltransferase
MAENEKDTFFDHFSPGRPTKFGSWLVKCLQQGVFEFAQIQRGSSVLEIGPGKGVFADICINCGAEYMAIEANAKMADALEKRGVKVLRNIVPPMPQIEKNFDVVVMIDVMEHMDNMTTALEVAKQVYKMLSQGGRFVIYSPDYVNWKYHFFLSDFTHNYVTTWRRLQGLLISAGFDHIEGIYQSNHYRGVMCLLISALASWLPFGYLTAMFPNSKLLRKLYKLQTPFLRRVLVRGEKTA